MLSCSSAGRLSHGFECIFEKLCHRRSVARHRWKTNREDVGPRRSVPRDAELTRADRPWCPAVVVQVGFKNFRASVAEEAYTAASPSLGSFRSLNSRPCPPQLFTGTTILCRSGIRTQDDLYTTKWGKLEDRDIERFFLGRIDPKAVRRPNFADSNAPTRTKCRSWT